MAKKNLVYILCFVFMSSCTDSHSSESIKIDGYIDDSFLKKLKAVEHGSWIEISSLGGEPDMGEQAANLIKSKNLNIHIGQYCISSCAEYILPAANQLDFTNSLVGFHQSPLLITYIKEKNSNSNLEICDYAIQAASQNSYQDKYKREEYLWQVVYRKLELKDFTLTKKTNCIRVGFKFENDLWFPTSDELKIYTRLKFSGNLCADNIKCVSDSLKSHLPPNIYYRFGEDIFIQDTKTEW